MISQRVDESYLQEHITRKQERVIQTERRHKV